MIAARKKDHGSRIPLSVKKEIALESIKRERRIQLVNATLLPLICVKNFNRTFVV